MTLPSLRCRGARQPEDCWILRERAATPERMSDVQTLIDEGESEQNIARFIASHDDFTQAERALARIVLDRHGLARGS